MTPDGLCHISIVPHLHGGLQHPGGPGVVGVGVPGVGGGGVLHPAVGVSASPDPWGDHADVASSWGLGGGGVVDGRSGGSGVLGRGGGTKEKRF